MDELKHEKETQPESSPQTVPNYIQRVDLDGKEVILIGTAHVSQQSVEEVERIIEDENPDTVCVELCDSRYQSMTNPDNWKKMDIIKLIKERKGLILFAQLMLSRFQQQLGLDEGVKPGAEMLAAVNLAKDRGYTLELVDRDIRTTLLRAWKACSLWQRMKIAPMIMLTNKEELEKVDAKKIDELKNQDMISSLTEAMESELPAIKKVMIDERDAYMVEKIRQCEGSKVVAVVGAGHLKGMLRIIEEQQQIELDELTYIKKGLPIGKIIGSLITVFVLSMITLGFINHSAETGFQMIGAWILANGIATMIAALLVMAHPVTIILSFFVAPLTSLTPVIGAGIVLALVQALVWKPRVSDFEGISKDILSLRGWLRNRLTKVLLVLIGCSLGSMVGTFVGIPYMTTLLYGAG